MSDDLVNAEGNLADQAAWGEGFYDRALKQVIADNRLVRTKLKTAADRMKALEDRVAALERRP